MSARLPTPDPFGMTADPEIYMPRAATERALAELERALLAGEFPVALTGPAGIGKTLLLRVAERRLAGRVRCVYVAYGALSPAELCSWVLGLLGEPLPANGDAEGALLSVANAFAQEGTPLALLIDDASAVPPETAERIQSLAAGSRGALQVVAADMDDASCEPWVTRFGTHVEQVRLEAPMNAAETALYIRARLERGAVPPVDRSRLDARAIDRIFRRSSGIPRAVQALTSEFLRIGEAALPREALEALLAREDTSELADRVAGRIRAREVAPLEPRARSDATTPPSASAVVSTASEPQPPQSLRPLATPSPSQPPVTSLPLLSLETKREFRAQEPSPGPSAMTSVPAREAPELKPWGPVARPADVKRSPTASPIAAAATTPEPQSKRSHSRTTLVGAFVLGGILVLTTLFLRNSSVVPATSAPGLETSSPESAKPPTAPSATPPTSVAAPESLAKEPVPPPLPKAEATAPDSGAADHEPSSASAGAPRVAEVPPSPIPVHINATPWATIEVDGRQLGETPIAGVPLVPGNHVFKARMPDGRILEKTVQIGAETRYVTFQ